MPLDQTANFQRAEITDGFPMAAEDNDVYFIGADEFPDPANGEYNLVIFDQTQFARPDQDPNVEIVRATSRLSSVELAVDRGQEGTTAADHPAGSAVMLTLTAGFFDDVAPEVSGPNPFDSANTFTESDLSINTDGTNVTNGSIQLQGEVDNSTGPSTDSEGARGGEDFAGVNIKVNETLPSLSATFTTSNFHEFAEDAILETSSGTEIARQDGTLNQGEVIQFNNINLQPGEYKLFVNGNGSSAIGHKSNPLDDFPRVSQPNPIFEVTGAFDSRDSNSDNFYAWDKIEAPQAPQSSGSATFNWDYPEDIFSYDVATFTRTLDNETVDVYIAYSTDGGSTYTRTNGGNPISRNYSLADDNIIDASMQLRFEVEISRQTISNEPSLDSAYLTFKL